MAILFPIQLETRNIKSEICMHLLYLNLLNRAICFLSYNKFINKNRIPRNKARLQLPFPTSLGVEVAKVLQQGLLYFMSENLLVQLQFLFQMYIALCWTVTLLSLFLIPELLNEFL